MQIGNDFSFRVQSLGFKDVRSILLSYVGFDLDPLSIWGSGRGCIPGGRGAHFPCFAAPPHTRQTMWVAGTPPGGALRMSPSIQEWTWRPPPPLLLTPLPQSGMAPTSRGPTGWWAGMLVGWQADRWVAGAGCWVQEAVQSDRDDPDQPLVTHPFGHASQVGKGGPTQQK